MRSGVLALTLLLAFGCASSDSGKHALSVDVIELRPTRVRVPLVGQHQYVVHIRNLSEKAVVVQSIHLDPVGTSDVELVDATLAVEATIVPGAEAEFNMLITVLPARKAMRDYEFPLDSFQVTIGCLAENGDFFESEVVPVRAQAIR